MPELPEVEVLVRHLRKDLMGHQIREVEVRRPRAIRPTSLRSFRQALVGSTFETIGRRGKFIVFTLLRPGQGRERIRLVGHLGMTGRMSVVPLDAPLPRHVPVRCVLENHQFVFEDTRYFGRLTLDATALDHLGLEPLSKEFKTDLIRSHLARSTQAIKVKLLDQTLIAGVGNIYASEALFRAQISPRTASKRLSLDQLKRLTLAIREVLEEAIRFGSTLPLDFPGSGKRDGLFYYGGSGSKEAGSYEERLQVYDREGRPCYRCGKPIRRIVQAARSTFFCPSCQKARA